MPTEVVSRIQVQATQTGVAETTAGLKGLAGAQDAVVASSTRTEKASLSIAAAYDRQSRQVDIAYRSTQQLEKALRVAQSALDQGIVSADAHAKRVALLSEKYGQASVASKAWAAATSGVSGQLIALSAGAGPVGTFLSALGPWGIAAAVGLGAAEKSLGAMVVASHELAQKSQELREFSEVTGLTTAQVQALRSEAAKFGVTGDEVQSAVQQFTARFNELRIGQGELLTQVRRVNPALADQMASATDAATAMTLFGKALDQTNNVFERNALVKAAAGKGGLRTAEFFSGLDVSKVTQSYVDAGKALDDNLIKKLSQLEIEINKTSSASKKVIASIFAEDTLKGQLEYEKSWLDFANSVKNFSISGDLRYLLESVLKIKLGGQGTLLGSMGINYEAGYKAPAAPAAPESSTFAERFAPAIGSLRQDDPNRSALYDLNKLKAQVSALGEAATAAQKLKVAQGELAISGKEAGLSEDQLTRASGLLNEAFANQKLQANVAAMGSAATVTEQYTAKVSALHLQLDKGEISQQAFNRALGGLKGDENIRALSDAVSVLGDLASPAEQYQLAVAKLQQQLDQGRISQDTFNRALGAAGPLFKEVKDLAGAFASGFAKDLLAGVPAITALKNALGNLASSLADAAVKQLVNQAMSAVAGAIGGAASGTAGATASATILTTAGTTLAAQMVAGATQAAAILTGSGAAAGTEVAAGGAAGGTEVAAGGGVAGTEVAAGGATAGTALAAGGTAASIAILGPLALLLAAVAAAAAAIGLGNSSAAEENRKQVLAASQDRSLGYLARAQLAGLDTNTREGALRAQEIQFAEERRKDGGDGIYQNGALVAAQQAERLALIKQWDAKDLAELNASNEAKAAAEKQALEDSLKRQQSYQDRLFNATTDTSTLAGALAAFDRKSNQERIDEMAAGGQAISDLVAAQEAERLNIYKQFNDAAIEAAKQAADYIKGVAKSINDFLQGLKTGANSILSPQDQLAAARSFFTSQIGLAQGGNKDALDSITQTAQKLLDASKAFNASGSGYVQDYNLVTSALQGLGYAKGGLIPGYASGGMVGNGIYGVDSVLASFAGGGNIALAGGEFVMPAAQTRTHLPQLEAMRSGASNDNAISSLGQQLVRALVGVSGAEMNAWREGNDATQVLLQQLIRAVQGNKPPVPRPGSETRPKAA